MPPPRNRERDVLIAVCAVALLVSAYLAWRAVGWFGVGLLGLLVLFIAVRIDLEGNRPIGPPMTADLHASQYRSEAAHGHAERAGRTAERGGIASAARLASLFGGGLAVAGFGLFFLL
ncbi:hypothetical protein [Bosea sp. NBC_00550]|jgi:hypothetical protein|uniref:hypothetical protein n=1 Tax=Bosea sp. NBC_00550 TaxID=2969621 RepID=UPI0022325290|nr:hypothetical protein [Bosea sp. NBC_00550]UZF93511.1 hypothetical protein NWE53_04735 [Bosea sp. NBC_00550]